jgi:SAM-dependent methyltransferase
MKFHAKAIIQRIVSCLPDSLANKVYYAIQRRWGRLQHIDPIPYFKQAILLIKLSREHWPANGPAILEVGTGRTVNIPFAFWLAGAGHIATFDLNGYLRPELIVESLDAFRENRTQLQALFSQSGIPIIHDRWDALLACSTAEEALSVAHIEYHAPADAANTAFPPASIDLHISVNVLEHVPHQVLKKIFAEAHRILRPQGCLVHTVDTSDHFAQTDPQLNAVNFLRYSQHEWTRIAGNQYMYQNRLRASEYLELLKQAVFSIENKSIEQDMNALKALTDGFPIHADFQNHAKEDLATTKLDFLARIA